MRVLRLSVLRACITGLFLFTGIFFFSCKKEAEKAVPCIKADLENINPGHFWDEVAGVDLLPLHLPDSIIIGKNNDLIVRPEGYYVVNRRENSRIFRFTENGTYTNAIGDKGRGPGEYTRLRNAQVTGDTVIIFSPPDLTFNYYNIHGEFLKKEEYGANGREFYKKGNRCLIYNGYGMPDPERVFLLTFQDGARHPFLYTEAEVMNVLEDTPVMYAFNDELFLRETYCDTVYRFSWKENELAPYLIMDFGKYAIGKDFFKFGDVYEAIDYLESSPYATIYRYLENSEYRLIEVVVSSDNSLPDFIYGIQRKDGDGWKWFSLGKITEGAFANSFRLFYEGKLYCLLEPYLLKNLTAAERAKIRNPELIGKLGENDNPVIGIITFKDREKRNYRSGSPDT